VGERTGDDEAYSAVFAAVVAVFVLLVVRLSIAIAIVHPEAASTGVQSALVFIVTAFLAANRDPLRRKML